MTNGSRFGDNVEISYGNLPFTVRSGKWLRPFTIGVQQILGWWELSEDNTLTLAAPGGIGVLSLQQSLGPRSITLKGWISTLGGTATLEEAIDQIRNCNNGVLKVKENLAGLWREADVRVTGLEVSRRTPIWADFTLSLQADDPLRYGTLPPERENLALNPQGLASGQEWVTIGAGSFSTMSYEVGPPPRVRRTYLRVATAPVYMSPVGMTDLGAVPGAWISAGAWVRRSDDLESRALIVWRDATGAAVGESAFRWANPGAGQWAWLAVAAQVPEGAAFAQPLFGSKITEVEPGAFIEVTGVVATRSRLAPLPEGELR